MSDVKRWDRDGLDDPHGCYVEFADHAAEVARLTAELDAGIEAGWHALRNERDALKARVEGLKGRVEGLEGALRELQQRREKDLNTEDKK